MAGSFLTQFWCSFLHSTRSARGLAGCSRLLLAAASRRPSASLSGLLSAADVFGRGLAEHGGRGSSMQLGAFSASLQAMWSRWRSLRLCWRLLSSSELPCFVFHSRGKECIVRPVPAMYRMVGPNSVWSRFG